MIAPPPLKLPPRTATMDEYPPLRRVRFRLWQISLSSATVLVTAWCYTLGPFAAIVATVIAKHVLVAILAAGLDLPDEQPQQ
jgi:hypothetical protein